MGDAPYQCSQVPNRCPQQQCCSLYDGWVAAGSEGEPSQRSLSTEPWCCDSDLRCSPFTANTCFAATPQPLPPTDDGNGAPTWAVYVVICLTLVVLVGIVAAMIIIARRRSRVRREEKERAAAETRSRFRVDDDGNLVRIDVDKPAAAADGSEMGESPARSPSVRSDSTDIQAAMSAVRGKLQEHHERLPVPRHGANVKEPSHGGKARKDTASDDAVDDGEAANGPVRSILKNTATPKGAEAPVKRASFRFSSRIVGATDAAPENQDSADGHSRAALTSSCVQAMTTAALPAGKDLGTFSSVDTSRVGYAYSAAHRYESGDASVVALVGDSNSKNNASSYTGPAARNAGAQAPRAAKLAATHE